MKARAKKVASADKVERAKTGGGIFVSQVTEQDEKMLALMGNRAQPMQNPFDSDAMYNGEKGTLDSLRVCYVMTLMVSH